MSRVIAIANHKGGVGKTTTAVNLSACIAAAGRQVLLIDLDPQGNATSGLGIDKNTRELTVYDALVDGVALSEVSMDCQMRNLRLVPSNRELVGAEVELVGEEGREFRLRECLAPLREQYEFVFIDCPPSLSLLTVNGLCAADGVIIPLQCEYYALEGLSELLGTIKLVRDKLNARLRLEGILLTMHQHTNLSSQVIADVRNHMGNKVYETVIPRNVTLSEAPSHGKPVIFYDLQSAGAKAYLSLAREVVSHG